MEYKVGKPHHCPKCGSPRARIVWIRSDKKAIGVKCPCNHLSGEAKYMGELYPIYKKNTVFIIRLGEN